MITFLILGVLIVLCIFALFIELEFVETLSSITLVLSILFLVIHSLIYFPQSYAYNMIKLDRETFETSLNESRKNGNEFESAAILTEVIEFNSKLARKKYNNKNPFLGQYIDDRIENIKAIK